ncbi:unnamed protein product [Ilex paraguariensis]|uniref:Uncharacterized protein n=1 Tax=Ilex paraguariensis TaxID=185542 RepID=A0ABC8R4R9_9AQUA
MAHEISDDATSLLKTSSILDQELEFKYAVEVQGCDIDTIIHVNGRTIGAYEVKKLNRTPLMLAAMFGSIKVATYILVYHKVDINRSVDTDGLTVLDCAYCYEPSMEIINLLVSYGAEANFNWDPLNRVVIEDEDIRKRYDDASSTDGWVNQTNDFMINEYRTNACRKMYIHQSWPCECPDYHPNDHQTKRRDLRKHYYMAVSCLDFQMGYNNFPLGSECRKAHGNFEADHYNQANASRVHSNRANILANDTAQASGAHSSSTSVPPFDDGRNPCGVLNPSIQGGQNNQRSSKQH